MTPLADAVTEALANRPEVGGGEDLRLKSTRTTRAYIGTDRSRRWIWSASYTRQGLAGPEVVQAGGNPFTSSFGPSLID